MNNFFKRTAIIFSMFAVCIGYAQSGTQSRAAEPGGESGPQVPNQTPPAPEAYKFAQYGNIPVNESSGNASVEIPLYNFKSGRIELPISISHSGGAVKVDETNSWTGMKWDLSAGGLITRTVNDLVDEDTSNTRLLYPKLNVFTPNYSIELRNLTGTATDSELDIFNFNFLGYSGSFYLDEDRKTGVLIRYDKELKIEISGNPTVDGMMVFNKRTIIITTPDGTKYHFGGVNASEATKIKSGAGQFTKEAQTGFYLFKIENYLKDSMTFEYKILGPSGEQVGFNERLTKDEAIEGCPGGSPQPQTKKTGPDAYYLESSGKVFLEKIISGRDNSKIIFNCSLQDSNNLNRFILNSMVIQDKNDKVVKKIEFKYLIANSTHFYKRFFLENVKFFDNSGTVSDVIHSFEYNSPELLPERFSKGQDYAGYYNGKSNTSLIPKSTDPLFSPHNLEFGDRSVDPAKTLYGTLKKVTYPTKGYTEFEYESAVDNTNPALYRPGVRILRTKSYPKSGSSPLVTRYYYNKYAYRNNANDSHFGMRIPDFDGNSMVKTSCSGGSITIYQRYRQSDTQNNVYTNDSNSGFYRYVTVSYGGDYFENGGKETEFFVQADIPLSPFTFTNGNYAGTKKESNNSLKNGTVLREIYFSKFPNFDVNTGEINTGKLKEITNTYLNLVVKSKTVTNCLVNKVHEIGTIAHTTDPALYVGNYYFGTYYTYSWWHTLEKTVTKEYLNGVVVENTTNYHYDAQLAGLPSRIESSNGTDTLKTENTYPSSSVASA